MHETTTYRGTHTASHGRAHPPEDKSFVGDLGAIARRRAAPCAGPRSNIRSHLMTRSRRTGPVGRRRSLARSRWAACLWSSVVTELHWDKQEMSEHAGLWQMNKKLRTRSCAMDGGFICWWVFGGHRSIVLHLEGECIFLHVLQG